MAFSSKLLTLSLSASLLRSCRLASPSPLSTPSRRLPGPLRSLRFCSAAATTTTVDVADSAVAATTAVDAADTAASAIPSVGVVDTAVANVFASHPWPEWGDFLDKLRTKGYFERSAPASGASAGEGAGDGEAAAEKPVASADTYPFRDLNRVKNACLKFARERYDLVGCLPKQDIQAIVQCGCPNIFRKAVNSAKRLRQFAEVEEKAACDACKLRGSCDKAYLVPIPEEGREPEARTVDVVRILLSYAIDPTSLSGENSVDGGVQESARKLLSELTARSDTAIDPSCIKPVSHTSSKSKESGTKTQESVGKGSEKTETEMKPGDWLCTNCNFLNFARNRQCLECKADGPKKIKAATSEMKMGDWICTQCQFMNFSRNKICFKCEEPRPKRQLNPGEWECSSCCYINFGRNKVCRKCEHDRPEDDTQDNRLGQRNIRGASKSRTFDCDREEDDDDHASRYGGVRKHGVGREERGPRRSAGFADQGKDLLTSKSKRRTEDDDVLPYEGGRKHVGSKRATPAQRRFTAAR
ncbi:hypothetical protein EJB05_04944 [Eragrostis curvula]|uniref:RanBP2-type domain-containing protein n=1 Tax=Eragrostis curvula TaxID=38414 RepID=A0A5J9WC36_9POAL|nr:hypothetical protein EJB05_04931 [Eragrostis curvula]TVU45457.1 hypothetical protein EJB05_04944 [Eragrostis curvula]